MHGLRDLLAFGAVFFVVARAGAEAPCHGIEIVAAPDLDDEWSAAVRDLQRQLPSRPSDCTNMRLSVESEGTTGARLSVRARDGRHADRAVDKPSALGAIALGLVASLPPDEAPSVPSSRTPEKPAPPPVPSATGAAAASNAPPDHPAPPAPTGQESQVWLGGGLGARLAEPTRAGMLDLEAHADLEVKRWFFTVSLRYGSSIGETLATHDASYEETVLGIGAGRTFPIGPTALQLSIAPTFASVNIDDADDADGSNGSRSALRFALSARYWIPIDKWWRFTVTADSDFSPRSFTHYVYVDSSLPPMPFWTGGLRVGLAGKLL